MCDALAARRDAPEMLTFVMLVRYTGMRAGEALGLHSSSIDLDRCELVVREQYFSHAGKSGTTTTLKSDASRRTLPIPLPLAAYLSGFLRGRKEGYLFNVKDPQLYRRVSVKMSRLSSVDAEGNPRSCNTNRAVLDVYVHPHLLRHTYATRCVASGMDVKTVQYLLGHANANMTLNVYSHYESERRVAETTQRLNEVFRPRMAAIG